MDPHSLSLLDPDPHLICRSGLKICQIKTEKCNEIGYNYKFLNFLNIYLHNYIVNLLNNLMFFTTIENSS